MATEPRSKRRSPTSTPSPRWRARIQHNAKGRALLTALQDGFQRKHGSSAPPEKAIIFTESRRTQQYLLRVLADRRLASEDIVLFNGSNTDDSSKAIYASWAGAARRHGSRHGLS